MEESHHNLVPRLGQRIVIIVIIIVIMSIVVMIMIMIMVGVVMIFRGPHRCYCFCHLVFAKLLHNQNENESGDDSKKPGRVISRLAFVGSRAVALARA